MKEIFKFNWVDILSFFLMARVLYISAQKGFVTEFFKTLATILGCFFSFHFYIKLGKFMVQKSPLTETFSYFWSFLGIFFFFLFIFRYLRTLVTFLFKIEPHPLIERWFSVGLGMYRTFLLISISFFAMYLTSVEYIRKSVDSSFSFHFLKQTAPYTYKFILTHFYKLKSPGAKINPEVEDYEVKKNLRRDSKNRDRKRPSSPQRN